MGGISIWQLLIILGIVLILFGTKRVRNLGGDLGNAIRDFKQSMARSEKAEEPAADGDTKPEQEAPKN